jgi:hypothetical protein
MSGTWHRTRPLWIRVSFERDEINRRSAADAA